MFPSFFVPNIEFREDKKFFSGQVRINVNRKIHMTALE